MNVKQVNGEAAGVIFDFRQLQALDGVVNDGADDTLDVIQAVLRNADCGTGPTTVTHKNTFKRPKHAQMCTRQRHLREAAGPVAWTPHVEAKASRHKSNDRMAGEVRVGVRQIGAYFAAALYGTVSAACQWSPTRYAHPSLCTTCCNL